VAKVHAPGRGGGVTGPAVVVAGEALIDLAPHGDGLVPYPGGSPFNVAVGLGRLGVTTAYLGALSTDGFGALLTQRLTAAGVDLALAPRVEAPTTLAVVHLDDHRRASYGFYLDATSAAVPLDAAAATLPPGAALHVSFGAVGPAQRPAGHALVELLRHASGHRLTSLDPNVRPSTLADLPAARSAVEESVAVADVVKASDEDLALLYPDEDTAAAASRWATRGPAFVVVTRGPDGAQVFGAGIDTLDVPGRSVTVADTVGAGDAFTSGLLGHLAVDGLLDRAALEAAGPDRIRSAVEHAVTVAAVTCTRPGADPPTADDLAAWSA
jgi:fructokinase